MPHRKTPMGISVPCHEMLFTGFGTGADSIPGFDQPLPDSVAKRPSPMMPTCFCWRLEAEGLRGAVKDLVTRAV